eukprot:TRINITY_DN1071_c0_g1_i5.p1 TRINITY_DN1071_c0_g1~~TRINITY_DN1071_c0_g1_i5.p1  ORF type:complete len:488 (-),score=111.04 TRINITY_DN1071_c0_g1_i5:40-1503(-)
MSERREKLFGVAILLVFILQTCLAQEGGRLKDLTVAVVTWNNITTEVIKGGQVQKIWCGDSTMPWGTCQRAPIAVEYSDSPTRLFTYKAECAASPCPPITVKSVDVTADNKNLLTKATLNPNSTFTLDWSCELLVEAKEPWTTVHVTLELDTAEKVTFHLIRFCVSKKPSKFDFSLVLIMSLASVVVFFATRQKPLVLSDDTEEQEVQPKHAILFIVLGSLFLLVLFFFLKYVIFALTLMILLTSTSATTFLLSEILASVVTSPIWKKESVRIPYLGIFSLLDLTSFVISILIVSGWFFMRLWILNNAIGIAIVCMMLKVVRLPSLKVAALLLSLAFFYDIFWVFGSKYFFGESVMAYVATTVDLPIKLQLPHFNQSPLSTCTLIGLGDLVLPGLFIAFTYQIGKTLNTQRYFVVSMIGYVIGLAMCAGVLWIYSLAQPALLYLVPCTLIPVAAVASKSGDLSTLWEGNQQDLNRASIKRGEDRDGL